MGTITYVRNITSETILVDMVFVRFLLAFGRALRMVVKNIRVSGNNDHLIINKEDESMQLYRAFVSSILLSFLQYLNIIDHSTYVIACR